MADVPSTPPAPAAPASPQSPGDGGAAADTPPVWFQEYAKKTDERFALVGKDLGKVRSKVRDPSGDGPAAPPASDAVSAYKLGSVAAQLPESARAQIDDMIANGASISEALRMAEFALSVSPAIGAGQQQSNPGAIPGGAVPPRSPPGVAASAAPRTPTPHPRSRIEYAQLAKSDPKRFQALGADDTFDPSTLPYSVR